MSDLKTIFPDIKDYRPRYAILSSDDETEDEAKHKYCAENDISINELEELYVLIRLVPLSSGSA